MPNRQNMQYRIIENFDNQLMFFYRLRSSIFLNLDP
jgi:hypothetical protein